MLSGVRRIFVVAVWSIVAGSLAAPPPARGQESPQLNVLLAERRLDECRRNAEREALVLSSLSTTRPAPPDDLLARVQRQARVRQQCLRDEDRLRVAEEALRRSIAHVP